MNGVLEKITLYDILGYLVPGSLLVVLLFCGVEEQNMVSHLEQWGDYKGALYFAFFLISYLVGIALSEAMTWVWNVLMILIGKARKRIGKENKILKKISTQQIMAALENSGIKEERESMKSKVENDFMGEYFSYVYGIIQKSDDCKRVHNYASAYVLYKNVAGALILGALIVLRNGVTSQRIGFLCIIMSFVFVVRGVRFRDKKNNYAIIWFVEKFTSE